jgi:aminopeptidase-like protein
MCEPQLGRRGLYQHIGGHADSKKFQLALLWTLNLSDGGNSLLDISQRSGLGFSLISEAADILLEKDLLKEHNTLN